jgi:CubicO group peptidase (beta-lactamase class C family)
MTQYSEKEVASYVRRLGEISEHDLNAVYALMSRAIQGQVTPGVRLWVGIDPTADGDYAAELEVGEGHLNYEQTSPKATADTLYDLASLTKPIATAMWFGSLVSQGALDPDTPIGEIISCEDTFLSHAPAWRLLNHSSGLPAHCAYYEGLGGARLAGAPPERCRSTIRRMITGTSTQVIPGERSIYSDLGYLLLENLCERVSGQNLAEFWSQLDVKSSLHFRPLKALGSVSQHEDQDLSNHSDLGSINEMSVDPSRSYAPTERCAWRKRTLCGEVHDDNAWLMGGVCGHAGLFGSAKGVGRWASAWMASFHGLDAEFPLSSDVTQWMLKLKHRAPQRSSFVLGWDTPSVGYSSAGQGFGRLSVGHLGFTGTSVWMDLERRVVMVLLTNRVHPDRHTSSSVQGIRWLRPQIHDEIWRLLRA